ncbi:PspC domain-containing protein [Stackebrandtia soli]|uniref:PspC domain-containing protein n=1 Tax=Stackebrandtia soli TaxID=1892856 RepID=UPI0039E948A5
MTFTPPDASAVPDAVPEAKPSGAFADTGLIRPRDRRRIAGVCAAFGDATGTDALLWRVVLAVLVAFGGLGIVLYVFGWLFFPGEGDEASAIEAVFGRGTSRTSRPVAAALVLGGIVLAVLVVLRGTGWPLVTSGLFGLAVIGLQRQRSALAPVADDTGAGSDPAYRKPFAPHGPFGRRPAEPQPTKELDVTLAARSTPVIETVHIDGKVDAPGRTRRRRRRRESAVADGPHATAGASPSGPSGTRPASPPPASDKPSESRRARRRAAKAAKAPKPRRAARVTILLMLIATAVLLIIAATPVPVPLTLFASVLLATCGVGLAVSSRRGGSTGLTWLGLALSLTLVVAIAVDRLGPVGYQSYTIASESAVPDHLVANLGQTDLDLTAVSFTEVPAGIQVSVTFGHMEIVVPPEVDVIVNIDDAALGTVMVDDDTISGVGDQVLRSDGPDGPGGGSLTIDATVRLGTLEVRR